MLSINTNILTPNGWIKISDLNINDIIFNKYGEQIKISYISDIQDRDIYEIIFIDNTSIQCSNDQLWKITTYGSSFKEYKLLSIDDILNNYYIIDIQGIYQLAIDMNQPIEFILNNNLSISPYIYGILANAYIDIDNDIIFTNIKQYLFSQLDMNDIINIAYIPYNYKYTSINNRIELLQGMINSYGEINKYGYIKLSIYKKQIFYDLSFIFYSLGYRFKLLSQVNDIYNIIIYNTDTSLFTNKELCDKFNNRIITNYDHVLKIKNIKKLNKQTQMINIIADSYICDNFIVCEII